MESNAVFFSPSKLNLFFRVIGKRGDGYHEIASLYQAIDLGDRLEVECAQADRFVCSDPCLPCDEKNLVIKALHLFRYKTGLSGFHVNCKLEKNVPIEAGLGGGSSNAATMLYACNEIAGCPASYTQLSKWSEELGSDTAFFFSSGSAYCTGRGELFSDQPFSAERVLIPGQVWIAKPAFGVSTPQVYQASQPEKLEKRDPLAVLHGFLQGSPDFFNDLEEPAFRVFPKLKEIKHSLQDAGFSSVVMTGSGSAFLCLGLTSAPKIEGLSFIKVDPLQRQPQGWYLSPNLFT